MQREIFHARFSIAAARAWELACARSSVDLPPALAFLVELQTWHSPFVVKRLGNPPWEVA